LSFDEYEAIHTLLQQDPAQSKRLLAVVGLFWQFGKLNQHHFTQEVVAYSAVENLQRWLNALNWQVLTAKNSLIL